MVSIFGRCWRFDQRSNTAASRFDKVKRMRKISVDKSNPRAHNYSRNKNEHVLGKRERVLAEKYYSETKAGRSVKMTIKEIAELAGVHRATVDKVLHNREGVSTDVRQRIQQIIKEVGYTPNPAGRVLQQQGKVYRIAAVLVEVDALEFIKQGIAQGVEKQAGFNIEVEYHVTTFQDAEGQSAILNRMIDQGVDGIILSPINSGRVRAAINRAADAGIPVVTANSDIDGTKRMCYVGMDGKRASRVAGRLMGQFLGGSGEVTIISSAVDAENNNYYVSIREQGFSSFIAQNYPGIHVVECIESFEDPQITYQKTAEALRQHPNLRGIYLTCGGAREVGRALKESGRWKDIKVLSYEEYPFILQLMREDVIDCTLASELQRQGELPIQVMMDDLVFDRQPERDEMFTEIKVLVKESLF